MTYPSWFPSLMAHIHQLRRFSESEINWAGDILRDPESSDGDFRKALGFVNDWRMAHLVLDQRFWTVLGPRARSVDPMAYLGARLKRIPTMLRKLDRPRRFTLWQMQDIGGLRAVVDTPDHAFALAELLRDASPYFALVGKPMDYIQRPKPSGYRSIHFIYKYVADEEDDPILNDLTIEVQIRTRLQHAWATSNEIVGTFRREALKSGEGDPNWLRLFTLAGAVVARKEGTPIGRTVPSDPAMFDAELADLKNRLNVFDRVSAYNTTKQISESVGQDAKLFVLTFNLKTRNVRISPFAGGEFAAAISRYREAEREHLEDPDYDTVLVNVDSVAELHDAFPNYFADTTLFLDTVYSETEVKAILEASAEVEPPQ